MPSSSSLNPTPSESKEAGPQDSCSHVVDLCIESSYKVDIVESDNQNSSMIVIQPASSSVQTDSFKYKLSCSSLEVGSTKRPRDDKLGSYLNLLPPLSQNQLPWMATCSCKNREWWQQSFFFFFAQKANTCYFCGIGWVLINGTRCQAGGPL